MKRLAATLVLLGLALPASAAVAALRPFETGFVDPVVFEGPQAASGAAHAAAAGAAVVRVFVDWSTIAPKGTTPPEGFAAADPASQGYDWSSLDREVGAIAAAGLQPLLDLYDAPAWAQHADAAVWNEKNWRVDDADFAAFATAAARRYGGGFQGLPRVRYWQAWNEPNLAQYFNPQYGFAAGTKPGPHRRMDASQPTSPVLYRRLVNAFAAAVHAVHRDNLVVAGGLAPFSSDADMKSFGFGGSMAPLRFMERLLCVSGGAHPRPTCSTAVHFDVWAHHPYTSGDPTHQAQNAGDVSLGDLPKMKAVLDAAWKANHIVAARRPRFWVTEFSWDTRPPDPKGVPLALQARWTSEALYQMWRNGVSLVTWFLLRDQPFPKSPYQSGLWRLSAGGGWGRAKPALTAFRFPFVAYPDGTSVHVWGRTPGGEPGTVLVQQQVGSGWRTAARVPARGGGVFTATVPASGSGPLRAVLGRDRSRAFSLHAPPDRFVNPFGTA